MRYPYFFLLAIFVLNSWAYPQTPYSLHIVLSGDSTGNLLPAYKKQFPSDKDRNAELHSLLWSLYDQGFLAASIDSVKKDSLNLTAFLYLGKSFQWAEIRPGNVEESLIEEAGLGQHSFRNKPIRPEDTRALLEKILEYSENHGYPFASVKLDSIRMDTFSSHRGNKEFPFRISASLNLRKNRAYKIDSIILIGNAKISEKYLHNYIFINPGDLYNEQRIKKLSTRIKELPFLQETKQPQVVFDERHSKLYLYLDNKKASLINGVIGFLPDAYNTGKTLITGDARLKLINPLGKGEMLDINWRKMQSNTNDLKINVNYPFLFSTPFGAAFDFKLYKRDTTFVDIYQQYGLPYILPGGNYFKAFAGHQRSSLISSKGYENITVLPNFADISVTSYGIGFKAEKLDYRLNPRNGFSMEVSGSAGNKQIRKNPRINPAAYDSLTLKSVQYKAMVDAYAYIPLFRRSVLNIGLQGAYLFNQTLFQNELFRFGGLNTLRGFDEESLQASLYSVFTLEYRFLLEQNSYFHLFIDGAYYENRSIYFKGDRYDHPLGFGSGISFETKAGIFSLVYALGKQFDNPILIKTGKVHFGFVNYF